MVKHFSVPLFFWIKALLLPCLFFQILVVFLFYYK